MRDSGRIFIEKLSSIADPKTCIVPSSSGRATELTLKYWKVKPGQRIIHSPGLASMGFAIPHAIGASIASNRRVICIEGDGSFQMNIQELEVIKRLDLNIKIFIFSNGGYDSIKSTQDRYFNRRAGCDEDSGLTLPTVGAMALGYGIDYTQDIEIALESEGPIICEVKFQ